MISKDEDALICDLAETYHIFNYRTYPVRFIATLAQGLKDDSRIQISLSSFSVDIKTLLLASIADSCNFIAWTKTESAQSGANRPESLVGKLCKGYSKKDKDIVSFGSPEEFERARAELIGEK